MNTTRELIQSTPEVVGFLSLAEIKPPDELLGASYSENTQS